MRRCERVAEVDPGSGSISRRRIHRRSIHWRRLRATHGDEVAHDENVDGNQGLLSCTTLAASPSHNRQVRFPAIVGCETDATARFLGLPYVKDSSFQSVVSTHSRGKMRKSTFFDWFSPSLSSLTVILCYEL